VHREEASLYKDERTMLKECVVAEAAFERPVGGDLFLLPENASLGGGEELIEEVSETVDETNSEENSTTKIVEETPVVRLHV